MSVTIVDMLPKMSRESDLEVMHLVPKIKPNMIDFNLRGPRVGLGHYKLIRDGISQHFFSGNNSWVKSVDTPDTDKRRAFVYTNGNTYYVEDVLGRLEEYAGDLNKKGIDLRIVTCYVKAKLKPRPKKAKSVTKNGKVKKTRRTRYTDEEMDPRMIKPDVVLLNSRVLRARAEIIPTKKSRREMVWKIEHELAKGKIDQNDICDFLEEMEL